MPELPEVETTRRGVAPHVDGQTVRRVIVRERRLRWPVSQALPRELSGQTVQAVERRAKYLLFRTSAGSAIVHLGMSGSLRVVPDATEPLVHDHVDIDFGHGQRLRFNDPRRFGCVLWTRADPHRHRLLRDLGPEPLADGFDGAHLHRAASGRRVAIKNFIMNAHVVVGVGNIYASEALFLSGIHPARAAGRVSRQRMDLLANSIRTVLSAAIADGGTTLRDFVRSDGSPGYFAQELKVYGRKDEPCHHCGRPVAARVLGQRSSFYCPGCQR
ncbi:MAG: bifunctional DNA-formamidopyrimidine glycosylase/DNA-(apurinic or apyrimidinic site) lyase [Pseudomonadota bacterium]